MTSTYDVDELGSRLPEMLAEVEAGHEVLLARGARPLARVTKEIERSDHQTIENAIADTRARRRLLPRTSIEDIIQWRDEDRR